MLSTKSAKRPFVIVFSFFSNKMDKKKHSNSFTTSWPVLWFLESFKQQGQLHSAQASVVLNELPQKVSLACKFCLTVHMQYFEISIFVVFKCPSIPMANSLSKRNTFLQKCKRPLFRTFFSFWNEIDWKKANSKFYHSIQALRILEAFEQQWGCRVPRSYQRSM